MGYPQEVKSVQYREGVWEKDEYEKERTKLLMTYDEVQNCTFQPAVRSKMPDKLKISEINPTFLYGKPETNLKKKVDDYKQSKEYKRAKMIGFFNKAMKEFREGFAVGAYKTLNANFNLDQIRKFFNEHDPGPAPGTALYNILHPQAQKRFKDDEGAPVEKMQVHVDAEAAEAKGKGTVSSGNKGGLLRDVFSLAQIIEHHQSAIERQIKRIEKSKRDLNIAGSNKSKGRAQSVAPAKLTMCPLGYIFSYVVSTARILRRTSGQHQTKKESNK